ncbi:MAG: hypothetical protein DYG96_09895, partial [Chlorobi bacterium CHB2]|nr:hypothetical protein [Chlorobi bacterium CHB2]
STGIRWPEDDGAKTSKIGSLRVTRLQRQAYDGGMDLLQTWARQYSDPTRASDGPRPTQRITLHEAISEFEGSIKIDELVRHLRSRYRQAWSNYLTGGTDGRGHPFDDIPVTYQGLKERILAKKAVCQLKAENAKKVQYKLRAFTRWLVRQEYLPKDPMDAIGIDSADEVIESDTIIDTFEEVQAQIAWLEAHGHTDLADYVRVTFMIGGRSGDARRMKAEHYVRLPNGAIVMTIFSKKTRANKKGVRFFPIVRADGSELIPGLHAVMERRLANLHNGQWLFRWRTGTHMNKTLRKCREALGLLRTPQGALRTAACWRASANVYWRDHYGWNIELRKTLLGHSARVNALNYSTTHDAPDAMRYLDRLMVA